MDDGTLFEGLENKVGAITAPTRKPIKTYIEGKYVIKVYQTLYDSSIDNRYTVRPRHEHKRNIRD